jgi:hypothetical protein
MCSVGVTEDEDLPSDPERRMIAPLGDVDALGSGRSATIRSRRCMRVDTVVSC